MRFPEEKLCKKCDTIKPSCSFKKDHFRPDGLAPYCQDCMKTYTPERKNKSFRDVKKTCNKCSRTLSARAFLYIPSSHDRLSPDCRTCRRYRGTVELTTEIVIEYERQVKECIHEATDLLATKHKKPKDEILSQNRAEFEEQLFKLLLRKGLMVDWKKPEWIHKTSLQE